MHITFVQNLTLPYSKFVDAELSTPLALVSDYEEKRWAPNLFGKTGWLCSCRAEKICYFGGSGSCLTETKINLM